MTLNKKYIRLSILVGIVIISAYLLWLVRNGLYPFILALLLAYLLNPAVCFFEKKGISRLWAIIIVYMIVFCIIIVSGATLFPLLVHELDSFNHEIPSMAAKLDELLHAIQNQYQNAVLPYSIRTAVDEAVLSVEETVQVFVEDIVQGIVNIVTHSIGLAITPVLAFYLLHDWYSIKKELLLLVPNSWRGELILVFRDINKVLNGIVRGQLTIAVIVGILVSTGLYIFQLKYALLIGILAGILDVIPYFGAIIGAAPAITIALLHSPWIALKVALLFLAVHQIEGTIIQPKILGESVGLHPLSVIFFVFIGGELGGLIGMLLGVPIAAICKVIIRHIINAIV